MKPEEIVKVNFEAFKKYFDEERYSIEIVGVKNTEKFTYVMFVIVDNNARIIVSYTCSYNVFEATSNGGLLSFTHTVLTQWINFVDEVESELRKYATI